MNACIRILFSITILLIIIPLYALESSMPVYIAKAFYEGPRARASAVVFVDNRSLAIGSYDGTVSIVDIQSGKADHVISKLGQVYALGAATPNILYVASSNTNYPLFYDYHTGNSLGTGQVGFGQGHTQKINALAVINPISMVTASEDGSVITLYKSKAAKKFNTTHPIGSLSVVNESRILAVSPQVNGIYIIDPLALTNNISYLPLPAGFVAPRSIDALSATRWAIGLQDGRIVILDSTMGTPQMRVLANHKSAVNDLSKINETFLVSGSQDGDIRIWNAETGKEVGILKPGSDSGAVYSMDTKFDSKTGSVAIVAAFDNGRVWRWDLQLNQLTQ